MALFLGGCASCHRVRDTTGCGVYHTKKVKDKKSGAVSYVDARTGHDVTLASSDVTEISKKEFQAGIGTK